MSHLAALVAGAACTLTWHGVPSPPLWGAQLQAVAASARDDAWAVGGPAPHGHWAGSVVEHWNGKRWRLAPRPAAVASLQDVAAIARNDVWAVGGDVIAHWDGATWRTFAVPSVTKVTAVSAAGRDDVWAVEASGLVHWDGAHWRARLRTVGLTDVTALAGDDVWAVGTAGAHIFEFHWDGRRWTRYAQRIPAGPVYVRTALISGVGGDVWAAANTDSADGPEWPDTILFHWSGRWRRASSPPMISLFLNGMLAVAPGELWLTAFRSDGDAYGGGARENLTAAGWKETDTGQRVTLGLAVDRGGGLWGVGNAGSYPNGLGFPTLVRPLIERARCS